MSQEGAKIDSTTLILPAVGVLAFFLKGVMGTGTTTVIVALGSLTIDPKSTVVLASLVNIFGGFSMIRIDPIPLKSRYWMPISLLMVLGSISGAVALEHISNELFQLILGIAFLITAIWFLVRIPRVKADTDPPTRSKAMDLAVGAFAGFCGGFIGINAPPLVLHFSRALSKRALRRLLVLIFLPAALAQTGTFVVTGLLNEQILFWGALMLPSMIIGIYLGNRTFHNISELWFRRSLGVLLVVVSSRLILRALVL